MGKDIDKEKCADLLKNKTADNHAEVMQKMGITKEEDIEWHAINGGEPADWSKLDGK